MTSFELLDSITIMPAEDWAAAAKSYKTVRLTDGLLAESLTGNDRSSARSCKGVYRWIYEDKVIYIGKASRSNNIGARQDAHLANFRNPNLESEQSGKKLRNFLETKQLSEMIVKLEYIDMSHCKDSTIEAFETACIAFYNPTLNFGK